MKYYQEKKYSFVLTSHYVPEGQIAVTGKLAYLEQVKVLAEECKSKEEFANAVKQAFPDYSGEDYLAMAAGFLYKQ